MGTNAKATIFLKECMADALLKLMSEKPFAKITINEITDEAGVHRTTWFRNFTSKNEALTFKLVKLWTDWSEENNVAERKKFTSDNAATFFQFNYKIRQTLQTIYNANLQSTVYDAFYHVMMPLNGANAEECYRSRFYSYALFGLLDEWIRRGFCETPEEMADIEHNIVK